jgi:hypothetical protein
MPKPRKIAAIRLNGTTDLDLDLDLDTLRSSLAEQERLLGTLPAASLTDADLGYCCDCSDEDGHTLGEHYADTLDMVAQHAVALATTARRYADHAETVGA